MGELMHGVAVTKDAQFIAELREIAGADPERLAVVDDLERVQQDWDAVERIMVEVGFKFFLRQAITIGRKHGMVP